MINGFSRRQFLKYSGISLAASAFTVPMLSSASSITFKRHVRSSKADFYVSPEGNDNWSGKLSNANHSGTDGPFGSLHRARDAVRSLRKQQTKTNIVVLIRGGYYQIDQTLVFGLEDSSEGDASITFAAYPNEKPIFSSGKRVTGWQKAPSDLAGLPEKARGKVWQADIDQMYTTLYDEEGMLPRARSESFVAAKMGKRNLVHFPKGMLKNWDNVADVELFVRPHHAWIMNVLPLVSVDEKKQTAQTKLEATYSINPLHFLKDTKNIFFENVVDVLDAPGEWAINSKTGKVYLWPRKGQPSKATIAPQLLEYIRIEGSIDTQAEKDIPVKNLHIEGLTFMHGKRFDLHADDKGLQHDWDFHDKASTLVRLRGAEGCSVNNCHFMHSGSGAIRLDLHAQNNQIMNNQIEYLGGAGILLAGYGPGTKDVNHHNQVINNHIHHIGQIYAHSPGVFVWQSGENVVANNLIHHTQYCGVIVSGCMTHFFDKKPQRELTKTIRWNEVKKLPGKQKYTLNDVKPYLHSYNNKIQNNEIHHAMETLGDGNAIYIRGAGSGNIIRRNYIHHLVQPMIMQAAIRTDGGQMDTLIAENIIYKCTSQGIILKLNNRAENNIIVDIIAPPRGFYVSLREGPSQGAAVKNNIFYSTTSDVDFVNELPAGGKNTSEDRRGRALALAKDTEADHNVYYCKSDLNIAHTFLAKQQSDGIDSNSLVADPLFTDMANEDFSLRPDSPALKLGFVPIDMNSIGLQS
ncbi:MAG: right-handed parallel beta-helix repeat-containing protein [Glaciecola sp.]